MNIFPNPVSPLQALALEFDQALDGGITISLYNTKAEKIYEEWHKEGRGINKYMLTIPNIDRGIYILVITNSGKTLKQKIKVQ